MNEIRKELAAFVVAKMSAMVSGLAQGMLFTRNWIGGRFFRKVSRLKIVQNLAESL